MNKNAAVIRIILFALVYNVPIVAHAGLAAAKNGDIWGQTGSAWYGTAFFSFGPTLTKTNAHVPEMMVPRERSQKTSQLPGTGLDQQLKIYRALASSA